MRKKLTTNRDVIALTILGIIIVGLAYYFFVYVGVNQQIKNQQNRRNDLLTQSEVLTTKLSSLQRMEKEMKDSKNVSSMPSYNNVKQEMSFLNTLLSATNTYTVNFNDVTRSGDLVRRNFSVTYTVKSYESAKGILAKLQNCPFRIIVSDVNVTTSNQTYTNVKAGSVAVALNATFYETLVDGKVDSALPAEQTQNGDQGGQVSDLLN